MGKYAIIDIGGSQLKVEPGKFYDIRRFTSNLDTLGFNKQISINRILLVHDEAVIKIGSPWLSNAVVKGRLLHSCSKKKKVIQKISCKKKKQKIFGYRESMVRLVIDSISLSDPKTKTN
ncbi:hypothetical protein KP509_04G025600 [Ceratopteris richardii]|uniref:Large ribosomal subunit protein bL21m n=1 Tax=Ceratopteris richardii TaxID=49495 RepID=A0A8T2UVE6_CERRI|nr:hypothetical protein KP509_04G025600 [Ceratopteris richardii]